MVSRQQLPYGNYLLSPVTRLGWISRCEHRGGPRTHPKYWHGQARDQDQQAIGSRSPRVGRLLIAPCLFILQVDTFLVLQWAELPLASAFRTVGGGTPQRQQPASQWSVPLRLGNLISATLAGGAAPLNGHAVQEPLAVDVVGIKVAKLASLHVLAVLDFRQ